MSSRRSVVVRSNSRSDSLASNLAYVIVCQRVFRCLGRSATIKITIRKQEGVSALFFEKGPVLIDGGIDAFDV